MYSVRGGNLLGLPAEASDEKRPARAMAGS